MNRRRAMMRRSALTDPVFVGEYANMFLGRITNLQLPLTSLAGGIGAAPIAGDLIVAFYGGQSISPTNTSGFTTFGVDGTDTTYDTRLEVAYKISDGTETNISFSSGTGNTNHAAAIAIQVWRGVNQQTPVASYMTGGGDGAIPNPPAATVGSNQFIITGGANCSGEGTGNYFTSTDPFISFTSAETANDGRESACAMGAILPSPGVFDPAPFGWTASSTSSHSWAAATLVIQKG